MQPFMTTKRNGESIKREAAEITLLSFFFSHLSDHVKEDVVSDPIYPLSDCSLSLSPSCYLFLPSAVRMRCISRAQTHTKRRVRLGTGLHSEITLM